MQNSPIITVVGGSGFLGRHLVKLLAAQGFRVNVLCRDTVAASFLKTSGTVGQIVLQHADLTRPETLSGKLAGSYAVINLVSILYQSGRQKFHRINVEGAHALAEEATRAGAQRFIHISALAVERATHTRYGSTKLAGEQMVREAFPAATILRPSLIIGPEDRFFQRFARMAQLAPALPLVGGGHTLFQPVLVEDVAKAILAALDKPSATFELAGPETYSFKQLLALMNRVTNKHTRLAYLPVPLAYLMGTACELLPFPPAITRDQVRMLDTDNVKNPESSGFETLGITPVTIESVLPSLLARFVKA